MTSTAKDTGQANNSDCNENLDGQNPQLCLKFTVICLVGPCAYNEDLENALTKVFGDDVVKKSETGDEFINNEKSAAFILNDFDGPIFDKLRKNNQPIYGPTIAIEYSTVHERLPIKIRSGDTLWPMFCRSMQTVVAFFSGFKNTAKVSEMANLIRYMGGSVRRNFRPDVTHLISCTTKSSSYRLAVAAGLPVMSEEWITKMWERRYEKGASALSNQMKQYALPPFYNLKLYFHGFEPDDALEMENYAGRLGAVVADVNSCTHIVVCNTSTGVNPPIPTHECLFVSGEWFWTSVQLNVCANEKEYPAEEKMNKRPLSPASSASVGSRKRSICIRQLMGKQNSNNDLLADSFGDASSNFLDPLIFSSDDLDNVPHRAMTKRQQICAELLQTETNYVQVLQTIIELFKEPLEKELESEPKSALKNVPRDQTDDGALLDSTEIKIIFGNLPPILTAHKKICEKLKNLMARWNENHSIGMVWANHADELVKCYPPFVNFFEDSKSTIAGCDKQRPRFHAFLKVRQNKPECGRQTLQELMIRPVQRLPSVILLLNDLWKHTDKSHQDYQNLQRAIDDLKRVLTYINEDKRKTEGQVKLFDIINDIKDCPPDLLSSQRQFLSKADVLNIGSSFAKKGTSLSFYLFNDCLEIAKKKPRLGGKTESRSTITRNHSFKTRKHKELLFLSSIRKIVDVTDHERQLHFIFLTVRDHISDTDHPFQYIGNSDGIKNDFYGIGEEKKEFLRLLCNQINITSGRGVCVEEHMASTLPQDSDLANTMSKSIRMVKVGRQSSAKLPGVSSTSSLRRTVSQAVVAFTSGTLRRMSRSNLRLNRPGIMKPAVSPQAEETAVSPIPETDSK